MTIDQLFLSTTSFQKSHLQHSATQTILFGTSHVKCDLSLNVVIMTIAMWQMTCENSYIMMLRNYKKKDTAMGRDISYRNNATLCVNRLEESVRVFSMGHISVFWDFINPVASNKSIEIFGSRVLVSRKHSYIGLDLTKVKHFV